MAYRSEYTFFLLTPNSHKFLRAIDWGTKKKIKEKLPRIPKIFIKSESLSTWREQKVFGMEKMPEYGRQNSTLYYYLPVVPPVAKKNLLVVLPGLLCANFKNNDFFLIASVKFEGN